MIRLLDTNVVIAANRGWPAGVRVRLTAAHPDAVAVTSITVTELWYGAAWHAEPERRRTVFKAFPEPYDVLPFDRHAAERHGDLRHDLRHNPIGERDLLIAAIAVANDMAVVTANRREFEHVPGLVVEDWSV